jgi:hypothetical protein
MKHEELVERAVRWLYSQGCGFAVGERVCAVSTGEIPDAIGFRSNCSILVECKTSRADFKADRKKHFRFDSPEQGMGNFRFYLCEEGVISPMEVPEGWGLLYIAGKLVKKVIAPKGNAWGKHSSTHKVFWQEKNTEAENALMYSCLRRFKKGEK